MPGIEELEPLEDLDAAAESYTGACRDADEATRRRLREEFVGQALPFARRLARRFRGRGEPTDDLEQVARLGLVKTVDRYDPERGSFTAYAVVTITGEIKRHFRNHTWGVHVPRRLQDLSLEITHATSTLTSRLSRTPTVAELAAHLRLAEVDVRAAQTTAAAYASASLNAPVGADGGAEMGDLIGSPDDDLGMVDDRTTVERLLCRLPERERRMLALRFYGNLSQSEIAAELGVSQMHVSRLLSRALTWLREAMLSDTLPAWSGADDTDHRLTVTVIGHADVIRAAVGGEVDRDNAGHLRDELLAVVRGCGASRRLVVNLSGVPLLDAAGIGALVAVREAARVRGVRVRVEGLQPYVAHIAAVSGLRDMLAAGGAVRAR
jgi:RNA polymerase sigma-B factor